MISLMKIINLVKIWTFVWFLVGTNKNMQARRLARGYTGLLGWCREIKFMNLDFINFLFLLIYCIGINETDGVEHSAQIVEYISQTETKVIKIAKNTACVETSKKTSVTMQFSKRTPTPFLPLLFKTVAVFIPDTVTWSGLVVILVM